MRIARRPVVTLYGRHDLALVVPSFRLFFFNGLDPNTLNRTPVLTLNPEADQGNRSTSPPEHATAKRSHPVWSSSGSSFLIQ